MCSRVMVFLVGLVLQVRMVDSRLVRLKLQGLLASAAKLITPWTRLLRGSMLATICLLRGVGAVVRVLVSVVASLDMYRVSAR